MVLAKKLKKLEKECRKAEDPVLLTLGVYLDHVVNYLEKAENDDVRTKEYISALAQLDLSAVVRAREALTVAEPTSEPKAGASGADSPREDEKKAAKKARKKEAKKKRKAEEAQAGDAPATPQDAEKLAEPPGETRSGEKGKKGKKNKKKGK